ncbi:MAG: hypothetical protein JWN44_850 [Myxococcales bacterium]|nr:hypothetical protein [Myxococcales bacterium]
MSDSTPALQRYRIGVSACLVGAPVRFDGGHKHDDFVEALAGVADLVTVCPEMELGLGTPRESMRLVREDGLITLRAPRSGRDLTDGMRQYAQRKAAAIAAWDLDGFIVKKDSPSCGMERVRVYDHNGVAQRSGRGLFTEALMAAHPLLVVEEEGRLRDPTLRENFLVRIAAHRAVRRLFAGEWRLGELVAFHSSIKLELLAHSTTAYRALGRLVAHGKRMPRAELAAAYARGLLEALARVPSTGTHVNVMQHIAGYFSRILSGDERSELAELIAEYQEERVPRTSPLTLLRHHARKSGDAYLARQTYLQRAASRSRSPACSLSLSGTSIDRRISPARVAPHRR